MPRQRQEALFIEPITQVFTTLVCVLGRRRWEEGSTDGDLLTLPRPGCRYARQTATVLRRGRVLDLIRPVSITLYETLYDPPCRVRLQLRWHVVPTESGSLLRLNLTYQLSQAARLRRGHWQRQLNAYIRRVFERVRADLARKQSVVRINE